MKVVLTGATSFVGAATVRELLDRGHCVTAVLRPNSAKTGLLVKGNEEKIASGNLILVENELGLPEALIGKIKEEQDVFCHFGWGGSGSDARTNRALQEENAGISLKTMEAARKLGCGRFLFSGSQAEYGLHEKTITEEASCEPRSFYGEAKLTVRNEGEVLCKKLGMIYLHARIFSAYGPGDHPWTLVESALDAFLADKELSLGACTQMWNFLYIDDLAKGMAALCETDEKKLTGLSNPVFNLGGAQTRPLKEFVEEIHALCGGRGVSAYKTRGENAEGQVHLMPSIEKMKRITGWEPQIDFTTGISAMIQARRSRKD